MGTFNLSISMQSLLKYLSKANNDRPRTDSSEFLAPGVVPSSLSEYLTFLDLSRRHKLFPDDGNLTTIEDERTSERGSNSVRSERRPS